MKDLVREGLVKGNKGLEGYYRIGKGTLKGLVAKSSLA